MCDNKNTKYIGNIYKFYLQEKQNIYSKEICIKYKSICFKIFLALILLFGFINNQLHANALDQEFNGLSSKKTPSQIKEPEESIVNSKDVEVREKDGALQSSELEVIDLYGKSKIEEKIDYSHCASYYKQASINIGNGIYAIKLKDGSIIGYNPTRPKSNNIIKYDPFVGLFLAKGRVDSKYAYELSNIDEYATSRELASAGISGAKPGRFQTHQNGFLKYAKFSVATQKNGVISNICYKIYGLSVGGNGFIEKSYIDRFLSQDKPYYGDIGARFEVIDEDNATFMVQFSDPFFPNNPFKRGDIIISINDIAPKDWAELELLIANLPFDELAQVKIRRGDEIKNLNVKVGRRYGGMLLADSFLERFDFVISNDFVVQKAPKSGPFSKLKRGDKILFINDIDMRYFKIKNTREKNDLLRELFTKIQANQVDFIEQKNANKQKQEILSNASKDIIEQFQSKGDLQDKKNSFYRKLSENIQDFENSEDRITAKTESYDNKNYDINMHSFSGDGVLREKGTFSMHTIYDIYGSNKNDNKKQKRERIKEYEELVEYGGVMTFLIDRQGFQFRVSLE